MIKNTLLTLLFILSLYTLSGQTNQNDSCQTAIPFCGSGFYSFPGGVNSGSAQAGPDYGCLSSQPNPAWYYMQIDQPGNIIITMQSSPALDIDFICWGPFPTPTGACNGGLVASTIVDCSYSGAAIEVCDIVGATTGQFYILLITNFSNQPCEITFSQTNYGQLGAGTTNCNLVVLCSVAALGPAPSACNGATNTYNLSGNIEFSNPPATGTLTITDLTAVPPVSQTFSAPFTSPQPYNLMNIPCDGLPHDLQASFSDSATCTLTEQYPAPAAICPEAFIHGGDILCAYPGAVSNVFIDLTGAPPFDFTYAIDGVPQTPVTGYNGPYPYVIGATASGVYTLVSVSNAACPGTVSGTATVVFNPLPVVTLAPFSPTCVNTLPFLLTGGTPAGGIYLGNAVSGNVFDPASAGTGTDTIIYRYTDGNGCTSSDTTTILVNENPVLTTLNNLPVICSGTATDIQLTSNLPGTLFSWSATSASPDLSGYTSGTGASISQVILNTGNAAATVEYIITAQAANCLSEPDTVLVTVQPVPLVTNTPPVKSICQGQSTAIDLVSNVAGTLFTWTCSQPSGNVSGYAPNPGPPANSIYQTLNLTSFVPDSVVYNLSPVANGCPGPVSSFTVHVNPVPSITTAPLYDSICSGSATNIHLTATCAGATFNWTAAQGTGNVSGFSGGSGDWIIQTLTNNLGSTGTVLYTITPSTSSCTGSPELFTVSVKPLPNVTNSPLSSNICDNTMFSLSLTADQPGTLFTWTCTPSSAAVTGWSNNAVPAGSINQQLDNSANTVETVTYHITPIADGCNGPLADFAVNVYPTPVLSNTPASQSQCNNLFTNLILTSNVAGAQFVWTCSPSSAAITGWSDNAVPTISINHQLINSSNIIETVTYHITPIANGCNGPVADYTVTVFPTPDLSNSPATQTQCNNLPTNIILTSNVAGTLFTWTCVPSSGNIAGWSNNAVPTTLLNQTLNNTGFNNEWVSYQITPAANGCQGNVVPFVVNVVSVADVIFTPASQSVCSGGSTSVALSSNVTGTTFTWTTTASGPGVSGYAPGNGNSIQQVLITTDTYPGSVTYLVSPTANGCPGVPGSAVVTVNPLPVVTVTACLDPVITLNAQPVALRGGLPTGGTWSGPGVSGGSFFPSLAGPGNHLLTYSYTNTWGCQSSGTVTVNVIAPAAFTCGNVLTDPRDSQAYPTVLLGGRCWFASNLNYGGTVPSGQIQRDNCVPEKYCFGDNVANCITGGGLYQWDELLGYGSVAGGQGLCPSEWHVPTEADWNALFAVYIGSGFAGSPLKYTGFSGFDAFLSGVRFNNVQWDFSNFAVMFWSSTSHGSRKAWAHGMNIYNPSVSYYPSHRNNAFPVRCIKD